MLPDAVNAASFTEQVNDAAFTASGSLATDNVEWSLSTGNLNFASVDVTSFEGQRIKVDYVTRTNVVRIPMPTRDRFMQFFLKESGVSANAGTIYAYLESNFNRG